jgi:hypothetical protein
VKTLRWKRLSKCKGIHLSFVHYKQRENNQQNMQDVFSFSRNENTRHYHPQVTHVIVILSVLITNHWFRRRHILVCLSYLCPLIWRGEMTEVGLEPVTMTRDAIPTSSLLEMIYCNCRSIRTHCKTLRCKCRKAKLLCTTLCGCKVGEDDQECCMNKNSEIYSYIEVYSFIEIIHSAYYLYLLVGNS